MEKPQRAALVYAGPVRRSNLSELKGLPRQLAFVKSSSIATASRAVTALRGGRPVTRYEDLSDADLIIISVPEPMIARVAGEMANACLEWRGRVVLLFDSLCDSSALDALRSRGASVASLNWSAHPQRFFGEGNPAALKRARSLAGGQQILVLESKALYLQAERASREDFYPVLAEAVDLFRQSGMDKASAEKTATLLFSESIRAWLRAGRRLLRHPRPAARASGASAH